MKLKSSLLALLTLISNPINTSEIPTSYSHLELLFRSAEFDGFNISAGTRISNSLVRASESGDVAITLKGIEYTGDFGIWLYDSKLKSARIVYRAPNERLLSNPEFTSSGELLFGQYDLGVNDGILKLGRDGSLETVIEPKNLERNEFIANPSQLSDGSYFVKTKSVDLGQSIVRVNAQGVLKEIFTEGKGPSYIFSPSCTQSAQCALKIRMGALGEWEESRPDFIIAFNAQEKRIVLRDDAQYADSFQNNVGINNHLDVAVIGSYKGQARLIKTSQGRPEIIARVGVVDDIKEFETFAPVINDLGDIAFRAIDLKGKRSLYYYNGNVLSKVLSEGDLVPTDRETGRIEERAGWPGFSSGLVLTNSRKLYFHAQLWNKSADKHLGAALYKLSLDYLNN